MPVTADLAKIYALEDRMFEVWISEDMGEQGHTLESLNFNEFGLTLLAFVREGNRLLFPATEFRLEAGDMLLLQGREEVVQAFCDSREGITFMGPPKGQALFPISTAELAEAVVPPRSTAIGKPIGQLGFIEEFGMTPIAYYRDNRSYRTGARDVELKEATACCSM